MRRASMTSVFIFPKAKAKAEAEPETRDWLDALLPASAPGQSTGNLKNIWKMPLDLDQSAGPNWPLLWKKVHVHVHMASSGLPEACPSPSLAQSAPLLA